MEVRRDAYAAAERQGRQGRDSHRFSLNFLNLDGEFSEFPADILWWTNIAIENGHL